MKSNQDFANAAAAMEQAITRGSTKAIEMMYYPALRRQLAALEVRGVSEQELIKATRQVQALEGRAFGEVFTYSIMPTEKPLVAERKANRRCYGCDRAIKQWETGYAATGLCEDCQFEAEQQAERDNAAC